jgi:hypothetical protein
MADRDVRRSRCGRFPGEVEVRVDADGSPTYFSNAEADWTGDLRWVFAFGSDRVNLGGEGRYIKVRDEAFYSNSGGSQRDMTYRLEKQVSWTSRLLRHMLSR